MQLNSSRISLITLGSLAALGAAYGMSRSQGSSSAVSPPEGTQPQSLEAQQMARRLAALSKPPQASQPDRSTPNMADRTLSKTGAIANAIPAPAPLSDLDQTEASAPLPVPAMPPAILPLSKGATAATPQASAKFSIDALVADSVSRSVAAASSPSGANTRDLAKLPTLPVPESSYAEPLAPVNLPPANFTPANLTPDSPTPAALVPRPANQQHSNPDTDQPKPQPPFLLESSPSLTPPQTIAPMAESTLSQSRVATPQLQELSSPQVTTTPSLADTTPLLSVPAPAPLADTAQVASLPLPPSPSPLPAAFAQQLASLSQTLPSGSVGSGKLGKSIGSDLGNSQLVSLEVGGASHSGLGNSSVSTLERDTLQGIPIVVPMPEQSTTATIATVQTSEAAASHPSTTSSLNIQLKPQPAVTSTVNPPAVTASPTRSHQAAAKIPAALTQATLVAQTQQLYASRLTAVDTVPLTEMDARGLEAGKLEAGPLNSGSTAAVLVAARPFSTISNPTEQFIPTASRQLDPDSYTLGPGDRIKVDIYNVNEYSKDYQVLANGVLNLFRAGSLSVNGKTIKQVEGEIAERYQRLIKQPLVDLTLMAARPLNVSVAGEVGKPGSYTMPIDNGGNFPTITRLIQQAGGMTQAANPRQIAVRRPQQGGDRLFTIDLVELFQTGNLRQDLPLRDGDMVVIPPQTQVNLAEASQIVSANFAVDIGQPLNIAVVGEVNRPGPLVLTSAAQLGKPGGGRPTVSQALKEAGGITQMANIREVEVRRMTRIGGTQTIRLNLWELLQSGDLNQDLVLQQGDTVMIPKATTIASTEATQLGIASFSPEAIKINIVGEVEKTGMVEVPTNSPLNQALLAAGGFNKRAYKKSVMLVRLNPDGTVMKREVSIDFAKGIDEKFNPVLQRNDIIIVKPSGGAKFADTLEKIWEPISKILPFNGLLR